MRDRIHLGEFYRVLMMDFSKQRLSMDLMRGSVSMGMMLW